MTARHLIICVTVAVLCTEIFAGGPTVDPISDPNNTAFQLKWKTNPYGPYQVFQGGVGLGGFDDLVCDAVTPRTLVVKWTNMASTKLTKAFLVWQAETDALPPQYDLMLDDKPMMAKANVLSSGTECNHLTKNHNVWLKYSHVYWVDVTSDVKAKLENKVGDISFDIKFTSPCNVMEIANGVSLFAIGQNNEFPKGTVINLQIGGVAYDKNTFKNTPAVFNFALPATGTNFGDRLDNAKLELSLVVGEGENQSNERPEGYSVNGGVFVNLAIDGQDGSTPADGPKWDTKSIEVGDCDQLTAAQKLTTPCLADTDNALSITFQSNTDCLIFVAMALEYQVVADDSVINIVEDPHITTWDGIKATLRSEGDFVMVESVSTGLAVHTRFAKNRRGPWAPWTTALAARCSTGSGFVEISADSFANPKKFGPWVKLERISNRIQRVTCEQTGLVVTAMRFRFHRMAYLNVRIERRANLPKDTRGLLGSPNGHPMDDMVSRDGKKVMPHGKNRGHYIGDRSSKLLAIQQSWRVLEDENMFTTVATVAPNAADDLARPKVFRKLTRATARDVCMKAGVVGMSNMLMCVHDAMLTGSEAGATNLADWMSAMAAIHPTKSEGRN